MRLPMVSLEFFIGIILPTALYGPEVDSAYNGNGYQECFLGSKGGQCVELHVPIVLKSGSLNLLEPAGPVWACTEIALPL